MKKESNKIIEHYQKIVYDKEEHVSPLLLNIKLSSKASIFVP